LATGALLLYAALDEASVSSTDGLNLRIDTPGGQGSVIIDDALDLKMEHKERMQLQV
jgi:ClpP class serine protease